jgi:hypothetical protein
MSHRARLLFIALLAVTLTAHASKLLEHVPLKWKATSSLALPFAAIPPTSLQFETFKDTRTNPELIAQNSEDESKVKPVTTSDDVGAFVSTHMRDLFKQAGYNVVESGGNIVVHGEVTQFFVRETGTYQSEVAVHLTLMSANGTKLWSGVAPGDASRFGRSYKLENYYEVLSDAIVGATSSMIRSPEFAKALAPQ